MKSWLSPLFFELTSACQNGHCLTSPRWERKWGLLLKACHWGFPGCGSVEMQILQLGTPPANQRAWGDEEHGLTVVFICLFLTINHQRWLDLSQERMKIRSWHDNRREREKEERNTKDLWSFVSESSVQLMRFSKAKLGGGQWYRKKDGWGLNSNTKRRLTASSTVKS